jgi:hypothetical protein
MKSTLRIGIWGVFIVFMAVSAFGQGIWQKYHTYARAISELQDLAASHPDICSLDSIGYSSRDSLIMYAFKISDNVNVEEDEPAIFFCGGVHSDEILGPEIVITFCDDIISKYDQGDTAAIRYINSYEIYIVPFINPEGHTAVENGNMVWRKNKEDNDHDGIFDYHDGVDNNRNYDFGWTIDTDPAATTPESLMYKGPFPFSEAENRSMAAFAHYYKPLVAVDYHSPTYGRSEKVYYNWYWYPSQGGHGFAPDEQSEHNIAIGFAGSIINDRGDSTYEARRGLVQQGDFKTYFYGNFGTAAFVCEVSDTTIQDTSLVDGICQRNLAGMYYLLNRSGYARLTGVVTDSITGLPLEAVVTVQQATSVDINPRLTRPNTGRYDRLIDPGTYTLIFSKDGYNTRTITGVAVNNSGPTVTNAALLPVNLPPPTPILAAPANGSIFLDSLALNFDWSNSSGATGYVIEIANDLNFTSYFEADSTVTVSNYRNTVPFVPGDFYWRVTAFNANGFSARSAVWHFTIQTSTPLPLAPLLLVPADSSIFNDSLALSFDWSNSDYATGYVIEIGTDQDFTGYFETDSNLVASDYRNIAPLYDGIFYWRVTAFNGSGFSPRSEVWQFTITSPIPEAPVLISPEDGFASGSAYLDFDWTDAPSASHYEIQIGTDSLFSPPMVSDSTLALPQFTNPDSLSNGLYFWRVRAGNDYGWSEFSSIWSFSIDVGGSVCSYTVGDANGNGAFNGLDVTYSVAYFKGGPQPPYECECTPGNAWYVSGDVNASCNFNGLDVTYMVAYFKGGPPPNPCPNCPPVRR